MATPLPITCTLIVTYLLLVRLLRYRGLRRIQREYNYRTRSSLATMTNDDAWNIQKYIMEQEFPFTSEKALQFALFRTYGIPSISKLLVQTEQLSDPQYASKRYSDTTILIAEFVSNAPDSHRTASALTRMNYLHRHYQKAGRISNADMLYTLALFATEPLHWINQYEWRQLTKMEKCAFGVYWKSLGDAMGIDFSDLPSSQTGWKDGLEWFGEIEAWSLAYETRYMVYSDDNKKTADETTAILLYGIPKCFRPIGRLGVSALMDARLRKAMRYETPPQPIQACVQGVLSLRRLFIRHLCLPRPYFLRYLLLSDPDKETGRIHLRSYQAEPWYVKPSPFTRTSLQAWLAWARGLPVPGDQGDRFQPQGFLHHEIGPRNMAGKGLSEFEKERDLFMTATRGGCPMAFGR